MGELASTAAAVARIRDVKFGTTRWDGYDEEEVDAFLDEMIARLSRGEAADPGVAPEFTSTRLRPGYRKADVNALLREFGVYC